MGFRLVNPRPISDLFIPSPSDVRDAAGRTALYLAAVAGHTDVVRYLLEQAADINLFVGAE